MNFLQALILGIIQGITEFLPISSSAHLVLTPFFFGWQIPDEQIFPFDVLVQVGTLVAVIIYFRKDLLRILIEVIQGLVNRQPFSASSSRLGWLLVLASLPAGIAGILLKDVVEAAFKSPVSVAFFLIGTAALLWIAETIGKRSRDLSTLNWVDAVWIGIGQALALFPGISRSGATIASGMSRNLDRPAAARFSFLMSIPIMAAAGLIGLIDLVQLPNLAAFLPGMIAGFFTAAIVGYSSIHWLLGFLARRSLRPFAVYCLLLAAITLIFSYAGL
ncbi:undecaprenyl-diphosphatase [Bellilinea caldifistulae]|uniref:Undecaprenyl-diphosphatase n=1 Tax=Bellilinea caldifistulae TaxID=360411 RepID=A0A0P6XYM7_9CHLR|nr:undecaprenyl-diphosphatase UppP [Bellilinea caldifistulae]KPL74215.1 hypothetical protein AC812_12950 [Bellilinea caldifistulae]GAP10404.1 undecaprenyl-diphosphatase [Bellilinea caldifistulae]